ncbi:MAG TPA: class I SAM-dependent methyltransferase [Anaerolineae bacterium]|nr:class I SAM-dependent methyltransferase [Anaerolineae bacterium]
MLIDLNRKFYDNFAETFATSRGKSEPGLERVLQDVYPGSHVLDLGCGQGRVAALLPPGCAYVGVDFSQEMLRQARQRSPADRDAHFVVANLLDRGWPTLVCGEFTWIVLRAVLHHIPGKENRQNLLKQAADLLSPTGRLVLANWQFMEVPRLRRRILDWEAFQLTAADVEPGDHLLDWRRDGHGLRYVHWVDEAETLALAAAAGLKVEALFRADGHQNNLTLYAVLCP